MPSIRLGLCALVLFGTFQAANAQTWSRFRGQNGTGVADGQNVPVEFSSASGILWKTPIPGAGNSSPIVWDKHVYLLTSSKDGKQRSFLCLDAVGGKVLWQCDFPATLVKVRGESSLASATAAADADGVYIPIWNGEHVYMTAFSHQGELRWKKDLGPWISQHGTGSSPILVGDKLIFALD